MNDTILTQGGKGVREKENDGGGVGEGGDEGGGVKDGQVTMYVVLPGANVLTCPLTFRCGVISSHFPRMIQIFGLTGL